MNELVHARGTQLDAEKDPATTQEKKKKKSLMSQIDVIALITGAVGAFEALATSDLADLVKKTKDAVKNPYVAGGLMLVYIAMVISDDN